MNKLWSNLFTNDPQKLKLIKINRAAQYAIPMYF